MTFEETKQQAIDRSEWVLCHGAQYFADFAENNELEFYENGICVRHR